MNATDMKEECEGLEMAFNHAARAVSDSSSSTVASAVLMNHPTATEGRTCCASILTSFHDNCQMKKVEEHFDNRR